MKSDSRKVSKFLSLILRHKPETIGISLDPHGWANIGEIIEKSKTAGMEISRKELLLVAETSDKKRFSISPDMSRIRAAQGHSIQIDLGLSPIQPPPVLYHGTSTKSLASVLEVGLCPNGRLQVHLSDDRSTAYQVGQRHGHPVVVKVDALTMHLKGFKFFLADNGVWLTDYVPSEFLVS